MRPDFDKYLDLYTLIEELQDARLMVLAQFTREERDEINEIIHRRIKDKTKASYPT